MKSQKTSDSQINLDQKEQSIKHNTIWHKKYYKVIVNKIIGNRHQNRHIDQWNKIDNPKIEHSLQIFHKDAKNWHYTKGILFSKYYGEN
jgi:hypothetical protein